VAEPPIRDEDVEPYRLSPPTQCVLWDRPELNTSRGFFESIEDLEDESHFARSLLRCRECGQLYSYEFFEIVDWEEGNDKQYSTFVPVNTTEEIAAVKDSSYITIHRFFPRLNGTHWVGK